MFQGYIHLVEEQFPRLYGLSFRDTKPCAIVLKLTREASAILMGHLQKYPSIFEFPSQEFGFGKFSSNIDGERYGFDDCLLIHRVNDGSIDLVFEIKKGETDQYFYAGLVTVSLIFISLNSIPEQEIKNSKPQFMIISLDYNKSHRPHGWNVVGEVNKDVRNYLAWQYGAKGRSLKKVRQAMLTLVREMTGRQIAEDLYIAETRGESGFLSISCPGNSCGLNTEDPYRREDEIMDFGANIIPHNIDGMGQQIVLLAALAALHDEVEKYYAKRWSS